MKELTYILVVAFAAIALSSCASNKSETATTTTTTTTTKAAPTHQQGTGLPSQNVQPHGM